MRTYTCKECGFSYSEADKHWDIVNSTNPCPKCAFENTKLNNGQAKKIKLAIVTMTVLLIFFAVVTNGKSTEYNLNLIVIIMFFMISYILPFIDKKDMTGGMALLEYNENNLVARYIIMAFAVIVSTLCIYKLLFG